MPQKASKTARLRRRVLQTALLVTFLAYFPVVMWFVNTEKSELACESIVTKVKTSPNILITEKGLDRLVRNNFPGIVGTLVSEIPLHEMEKVIEKTEVVRRCQMYVTPGGVLHVEISQREPIMRVFSSGSSYYMDETSFRIAANSEMRTNCVIVNGNVGTLFDAEELIKICKLINESAFWKSQIEQIFVTDKHEYILTPRVGDHVVEFGTADNYEEKFDNLYALYTHGWTEREWNLYKKVSLKYKGQIVCTKR